MKRNPNLIAVTGPLAAAGIPYIVIYGKHLIVQWFIRGQKRMIVTARTGSDCRGAKNNRAMVKRMLRQDGLLAP